MAATTLGNFAANGTIGTAVATVDTKTTFNINQTTANITLTLPDPTDTSPGRIVYVNNVGTVWFIMISERLEAWQSRQAIWNGTAWRWIGDQRWGDSITVVKNANQSVTNSNIPINDNELFFNVGANETWVIEFGISYTSPTAADMRFQVDWPAGATCTFSILDSDEWLGWQDNTPCNTNMATITNNATDESARIFGVMKTAGTAGTVQLQWAQNVANATTSTVFDGSYVNAYRLRGADYAEVYYSLDKTIEEWDIVSLAGNGVSQVIKSTNPYDTQTIGIISTKPWLVIGEADGSWKPVIVGLAGRVPVKVTTQNGDIKAGDSITTSDIPWVGMKATEPGRVIGKALTGYSGDGQGTVVVFIGNTYFDGIDDLEYADSQVLTGGTINPVALDRFSFMVKKSLGKIGSGNLNFQNTWSGNQDLIEVFSGIESTLESQKIQIWNIENHLLLLSWSIESLRQGQGNIEWKDQMTTITNITNNYILSNTGSEWERVTSIDEKNSLELITDVLEYITNLIVEWVQVIKEIVAMRIVALEGQFDQIFAKFARIDVIENTEITTKKLCINGTNSTSCISEKELRKLLEKESTPAPSQSIPEEPTPSPIPENSKPIEEATPNLGTPQDAWEDAPDQIIPENETETLPLSTSWEIWSNDSTPLPTTQTPPVALENATSSQETEPSQESLTVEHPLIQQETEIVVPESTDIESPSIEAL